jgi:hypothetical protein
MPRRRLRARARVLHGGGVDVVVLLLAEPLQSHHDLVGHRAQDVAVGFHALEAGEVERLADHHADATDARDGAADRHDGTGVHHDDGDDRDACLQRHAREPGAPAVELAVRAAGALGVDAEQVAAPEHLQSGVERASEALPPVRSIGICPVAFMNIRVAQPLRPCP